MSFQIAITINGVEVDRSPVIPDSLAPREALVHTLGVRGVSAALEALMNPEGEYTFDISYSFVDASERVEEEGLDSVTVQGVAGPETYTIVPFDPEASTPLIDAIRHELAQDIADGNPN